MKIEVWLQTNKVGSRCSHVYEIDDEDLEGYEGEERDRIIDEIAKDYVMDGSMWEWGWVAK